MVDDPDEDLRELLYGAVINSPPWLLVRLARAIVEESDQERDADESEMRGLVERLRARVTGPGVDVQNEDWNG